MADWVVYDAGAAAETLPPPLAAAYGSWLDAATRVQRLALLVSGVVADFRRAVAADADATGKLDADSVPLSCLRHVSAVTWYMLANEMGAEADPYRSAWLDSEIYLRRLYQELAGGGADGATATPRYSPGSLPSSGGSSATGALLSVPVFSPINYAPPPG